ncbi:hypothetical protein BDV11DRAFT_92826 [Aspergillus similis]
MSWGIWNQELFICYDHGDTGHHDYFSVLGMWSLRLLRLYQAGNTGTTIAVASRAGYAACPRTRSVSNRVLVQTPRGAQITRIWRRLHGWVVSGLPGLIAPGAIACVHPLLRRRDPAEGWDEIRQRSWTILIR